MSPTTMLLHCFLFALFTGPTESAKETWPLGLEPEFTLPSAALLNKDTVALGKKLFFDKNLSEDFSMSCATCHDPDKGFSNGEKVAEGVGGVTGTHNVPTILNRLMSTHQFWDGRAADLEAQALGPLMAKAEMAMTPALTLERLNADPDYPDLFQKAYGEPPNLPNLARAIAAFERTVMTGASPFDRYEWDGEKDAINASAKRGLALFRGEAKCSTCHIGTNFSDEKFHNLGVALDSLAVDPGRMKVTQQASDRGAFKTPTLRNITQTAPYMHDGSLATLADVVDFYDRGGNPNPNLDEEITPLNLTDQQKSDLVAFLKSLTGPIVYVDPEEISTYLP